MDSSAPRPLAEGVGGGRSDDDGGLPSIASAHPPTPSRSREGESLFVGFSNPSGPAGTHSPRARAARAPLDLDLPERRVVLDEKGRLLSVAPRERLDAHRLIEDYMIAANVAAAKALEAKKAPVMYRVHEPPSREKLVALKEYLATFDVAFALGQVDRPATFNHVLDRIGDADFRPQVMEQVLRTQTQAYYGPANHGHFGLALGSYAHFTSPIRRYADLLVHRSLVGSYALGPGALPAADAANMEAVGEQISRLERRAMEAERDTMDRYVASYLSERIGETMPARITGIANFGVFATVEGVGGDGPVVGPRSGRGIFSLRRGVAHADGGDQRRRLHARPAAGPEAGGGEPGVGRASVRAAGRQAGLAAAPGGPGGEASRSADEYPAPGEEAERVGHPHPSPPSASFPLPLAQGWRGEATEG